MANDSITNTLSGETVSFISPKQADIQSLKVYFPPQQEGTGNPSPENIRPINGWKDLVAWNTGKNLFNVNATEVLPNDTTGSDTTKRTFVPYTRILGTSGTNYYNPSNVTYSVSNNQLTITARGGYGVGYAFHLLPSTTYTLSFSADADVGIGVSSYSKNGTFKKKWESVKYETSKLSTYSNSFMTFSDTDTILITFRPYTSNSTCTINNIQLELGNIATSYEQFKGNSYTIWQTQQGLFNGGYVNLITGDLVQDYYRYEITGNESFYTSGNWVTTFVPQTDAIVKAAQPYQGFCSHYPYAPYGVGKIGVMYNERTITFDNSKTAEQWKQYCKDQYDAGTPVTIVYKLDTGFQYSLSPQQIQTLSGYNYIGSNAESVEIEYDFYESKDMTRLKKKVINDQPHPQIVHGTTATFNNDMVSKVKSYKVDFKPIQEGSGDPSPTNVRTITGHTGLDIWKSGKNIAHILGYSAQALNKPTNTRYATNNYGTTLSTTDPASSVTVTQSQWPKTDNPQTYQNGYFDIIDDNLTYNKRYNLSFRVTNITNNPLNVPLENLTVYYPSGSGIGAPIVQGDKLIYKNALYKQLATRPELHGFEIRNSGMSFTLSDYMVTEVTEEDQTYEAFKGNNLSVDWTSVAGTLYGGYIDLITGNLVAEWKKIKISDLTWYNYSQKIRYYAMINNNQSQNDRVAFSEIYSDTLTPKSDGQFTQAEVGYLTYFGDGTDATIGQNNKNNIWVTLPETMESAEANAWIQQTYPDAYIAYKLANPITYQLTPQQITTFNGKNNFWTTNVESFPEISFWTHRRKKKVIWNQWLKPYSSAHWQAYNSSYVSTSFSNGICTAEWLTNEKLGYHTSVRTKVGASQTQGDIIYVSYMVNPSLSRLTWGAEFGNNNQLTFNYNYSIDADKWTRISGMAACKKTASNYAYFSYCRGSQSNIQTGMTCQTKAPIEINLTQMFGAGNEPETIEEFERICILNGINLNEYQPYNTGTEVEWLI